MNIARKFIHRNALWPAMTGVLLLWLALPPLNWWWLGFLAPVPWCMMIFERKKSRFFYSKIYLSGLLFWLYEVHFVRYPHPVNNVLLLLLAGYMGVYLPVFIGVSRNLVHHRLPRVWLTVGGKKGLSRYSRIFGTLFCAPLVYMACDLLRGWVFTGYLMGSLCHAFYRVPILIQTADIMGEVGVSGLVILLAATAGTMICVIASGNGRNAQDARKAATCLSVMLAATIALVLVYGTLRLHTFSATKGDETGKEACAKFKSGLAHVALVQGNIPAVLTLNAETTRNTEKQYFGLTEQAVMSAKQKNAPLSLVVWPESIYRHPVVFTQNSVRCPPGLTDEAGKPLSEEVFQRRVHYLAEHSQEALRRLSGHYAVPVLTGGGADVFGDGWAETYNAAFYADRKNIRFYAKMHLVPFGEYVPFLRTLTGWWPEIAALSPIGAGNGTGQTPVSFEVPDVTAKHVFHVTPSICFESVVGRLIRRQIVALEKAGTRTDFLINVTNNGWFCDSHESQLHLACSVFRAVENRKKLLVAANYGISAEIGPDGEICQEAPHGEPCVLVAEISETEIEKTARATPPLYKYYGHWLGIIPLAVLGMGVIPVRQWRRR